MSVYDPLGKYLSVCTGRAVLLSFGEIEAILNRRLPKSAREYDWWWANEELRTTRHFQCRAWMSARWMVEAVDRSRGTVRFAR